MEDKLKVSCFGAGFVGLPTSCVLASKNPDADFVVFDIDQKRINSCREGKMPIFEPNLKETFDAVHNKNLTMSHLISDALDNVSVIFLALPTPTKNFGQDKGRAYDLSYTEKAINNIANYYNKNPDKMKDSVILVEKSTVPVGTAKSLYNILSAISIPQHKNKYIIASNPQFLAEGTAINDLLKPDRIVIGVKDKNTDISNLTKLYNYAADRIIFSNNASSELSKLVSNCFLAQRVSSINSIAIFCESYDANILQVKNCVAADTRIGDKFLNSSVGFGGSCFQKDILALIYLAQAAGLKEVADYWMAVINMNNYRKRTFFKRVYLHLNSNLKGKKLAIFGTAFKKETCDARESPAIDICRYLLLEGAILNLVDPKTTRSNFISQMKYNQVWSDSFADQLIECNSAEQAVVDAHAILVITQWDQFKTLPYEQFYEKMHKPAYIFDGRTLLDEESLTRIGYKYVRIGKKFTQNA